MTDKAELRNAALRALVCLDLTNLEDDCDADAVLDLCRRAQTEHGSVAAVCIWPQYVQTAKSALDRTGIRVATVVNFPSGDDDLDKVLDQTRTALADGADEIDLVASYKKLLAGQPEEITTLVSEVKAICGEAVLKAILETGALRDPSLIGVASARALEGGADFLKTSTGKVATNATPEAAQVMLDAISRSNRDVGFKAAGGVRTTKDAAEYLKLADDTMGVGWAGPRHFRIGASSLLGDLLAVIGGTAADDGESNGY